MVCIWDINGIVIGRGKKDIPQKNCLLPYISMYKLNDLDGQTQRSCFIKKFKNELQVLNFR
jgi:hypothetical protein